MVIEYVLPKFQNRMEIPEGQSLFSIFSKNLESLWKELGERLSEAQNVYVRDKNEIEELDLIYKGKIKLLFLMDFKEVRMQIFPPEESGWSNSPEGMKSLLALTLKGWAVEMRNLGSDKETKILEYVIKEQL